MPQLAHEHDVERAAQPLGDLRRDDHAPPRHAQHDRPLEPQLGDRLGEQFARVVSITEAHGPVLLAS